MCEIENCQTGNGEAQALQKIRYKAGYEKHLLVVMSGMSGRQQAAVSDQTHVESYD